MKREGRIGKKFSKKRKTDVSDDGGLTKKDLVDKRRRPWSRAKSGVNIKGIYFIIVRNVEWTRPKLLRSSRCKQIPSTNELYSKTAPKTRVQKMYLNESGRGLTFSDIHLIKRKTLNVLHVILSMWTREQRDRVKVYAQISVSNWKGLILFME